MALAYPSGPTVIRLTLTDIGGKTSVKDFVVPTTVWNPASDLLTAIAAIRDNLVTAIDNVTDALVTDTFIVITEKESLSLPAVDCLITDIASLVVNLAGGEGKKGILKIPCPQEIIFVDTSGPNRNVLDTLDAAVIAYVDEFQTTGGSFTISDGEFVDDTTPMVAGKRISRKSSS